MLPVEWVVSNFLARELAICFLIFYCDPYFLFNYLFLHSLFTFYCTIGSYLSTLKLKNLAFYASLVCMSLHVACPLVKLRYVPHFVLHYITFKKAFHCVNNNLRLIEHYFRLLAACFLKRFFGGTN